MKTIEQAAEEHVTNNQSARLSNAMTRKDFKAGVEFAQRWIPIEDYDQTISDEPFIVKNDNKEMMIFVIDDNESLNEFNNGYWKYYRPIELK